MVPAPDDLTRLLGARGAGPPDACPTGDRPAATGMITTGHAGASPVTLPNAPVIMPNAPVIMPIAR